MRTIDKLLFTAGAIFVCCYFFWLAGDGLYAYFSGDDLMNLALATAKPFWTLVRANLLLITNEIRPMGAAWYRIIYELTGFTALPFRAVAFGILALNVFLTYSVARRLRQEFLWNNTRL